MRFYSVPEHVGAVEINAPGAAGLDPAQRVRVHVAGTSDVRGVTRTGEGMRCKILDFCKEPRSLEEVAHVRGLGKYYIRRCYIEPLLQKDALSMTLPC